MKRRIKPPKLLKPVSSPSLTGRVIYASDAVNTCYEASKTCVAGKLIFDYEDRAEYLGKRVKDGHESVLEHSNLILLLTSKADDDLAEVLSACRYLKVNISPMIDANCNRCILIGGTIRGYKNLIRDMYDQANPVLNEIIKKCMDDAIPSKLLVDFADSHAFNFKWDTTNKAARFGMTDKSSSTYTDDYRHTIGTCGQDHLIEFVNVDPINKIYGKVKEYGFTLMDVIEVCSVTIKFKNMSRIITQQLTRHRNGITQEPQRYVSSIGAQFNTPDTFKPEKYSNDHKYDLVIEDPSANDRKLSLSVTMKELGQMLIPIYNQLSEQGVLKEDARYFLPQNTHSTVYMTFTIKSLFQFLQLRCSTHAQAEIRLYAKAIRNAFVHRYWRVKLGGRFISMGDDEIIEEMLIPKYMYSETHVNKEVLEEPIDIKEETVEDIQSTAEISTDPEEEMKDFGLTGDKPTPPDKSMEAAEQILQQYDPNRYANTRDEEKKSD